MPQKIPLVPRPDDVGRNAPGAIQASLRRERYKDSLTSDLGMASETRVRVRRPPTSIDKGAVILAIMAALITFALIILLLMWRDGSLPRLWPDRGFKFAPRGPTAEWMSGGERRVVLLKHKPATPPAAEPEGPIDAKAEWDAAHPRPATTDDEDDNAQ